MIQKEGGYERKVVLVFVCGVGSKTWVIKDDVTWLYSQKMFAVEAFA